MTGLVQAGCIFLLISGCSPIANFLIILPGILLGWELVRNKFLWEQRAIKLSSEPLKCCGWKQDACVCGFGKALPNDTWQWCTWEQYLVAPRTDDFNTSFPDESFYFPVAVGVLKAPMARDGHRYDLWRKSLLPLGLFCPFGEGTHGQN